MELPGMVMLMVGSQVTVVFPATLVALTTACGLALSWVADTGVKVAEPVVVASAVMSYWASAAGMVSAGVPVPVAKLVEATVAVQPAPKPRSSVTWTVPSRALRVPPGAAVPRLAVAGAVMERAGHDGDRHGAAGVRIRPGRCCRARSRQRCWKGRRCRCRGC